PSSFAAHHITEWLTSSRSSVTPRRQFLSAFDSLVRHGENSPSCGQSLSQARRSVHGGLIEDAGAMELFVFASTFSALDMVPTGRWAAGPARRTIAALRWRLRDR